MAKKRAWTPEEDDQLRSVVMAGPIKWSAVAELIGTRNAKQCRERWHYQLNPDIKKGRWTAEEDALIASLPHGEWARVARALPGRTDMAIKNRYHTLTKRKCSAPRSSSERTQDRSAASTALAQMPRGRMANCAAAPRPRRARSCARSTDLDAGDPRSVGVGVDTGPGASSRLGSSDVVRSTSSPELSALCDVAGVALDGRERPDSCSPELLRVWARAAELGTPEPVAIRATAGAVDRSATISAVSALSALSRITQLTPIAPCGGPLSSPELGAAFGVFDNTARASPVTMACPAAPGKRGGSPVGPGSPGASPPRLPASGSHAAAAARAVTSAATGSPCRHSLAPGLALCSSAVVSNSPTWEIHPGAETAILAASPALRAWPTAARPGLVARALHAADGDITAALRHLEAAAAARP